MLRNLLTSCGLDEPADEVDHARRVREAAMNLTGYLKANGAEFEFLEKATTHHASDASRLSGIPIEQIAKTIVFTGDQGANVVAVVLGHHMVSRHKLEACSGIRKAEVAIDTVAEKATGFPTGGIPPVGHRRRMPVYIDEHVGRLEHVWCGGGVRTRLVRLSVADIVRLSGAKVCDIAIPQP
jgi:Cys-tRNA(Pro) deacylase